jgi:hypothetical protein
MRSARVAPSLDAKDALAWLSEAPSGATVLMATHAQGSAVRCAATPEAPELLRAALAKVPAEVSRALLWQAEGLVPEGGVIALGGAVAASRTEALRAVDLLFVGLKGVATREDV